MNKNLDDLINSWNNRNINNKNISTLNDFELCILYNYLSVTDRKLLFKYKYLDNPTIS